VSADLARPLAINPGIAALPSVRSIDDEIAEITTPEERAANRAFWAEQLNDMALALNSRTNSYLRATSKSIDASLNSLTQPIANEPIRIAAWGSVEWLQSAPEAQRKAYLAIQNGPRAVAVNPTSSAQAIRTGNNLTMALGGPFVAAPMLAARQLGLDETEVGQAGMLGLSAIDAFAARGGGLTTGASMATPRSAVAELIPTSASNRTWANTLTNLRSTDPVVRQNVVRTLVQDDNGRYWLEGPTGRRITPSGSYDFVTMPNGVTHVTRPNTNPDFSTHLALSNGREVNHAGSIRFGNNMGPNRGTITHWTNNSGHYRPPADMFGNANLPLNLFRRH
jgi:hypothetical protein